MFRLPRISQRPFLGLILISMLALAACAFSQPQSARLQTESYAGADSADFAAEAPAAPAAEPVAYDGDISPENFRNQQAGELPVERLIIRTGNLNLVVSDTEATLAEIVALAQRVDGWVVDSSTYQRGEAMAGDITIRVPAEQFDVVMAELKETAVDVLSESSSGQDVTEEYVDLSARLENLEATADRVRTFLDEARNVEEALAVNQELSRLEGDIEALKGRLQFLSQSAAFSTISVSLTPDALTGPIEVAGWQPEGDARRAIEALLETLQGLGSAGIWLTLYILPVVLIIGLPAYFIVRPLWRRTRRWWHNRRAARAQSAG